MSRFVGRRGYMTTLEAELGRVRQTGRARLISVRGCVGKSRLVDEFLRRDAHPPVPYGFFTASGHPLVRELERFAQDVAHQELLAAYVVRGGDVTFGCQGEALTFLADPYLSFWLRFVGPNMAEIERGRGDLVVVKIREGWTA